MPIITMENAGSLSNEQKQELIKRFTDAVVDITGKPANYVYVRIDEVPRTNFGIGGKSLG
ncbi:MAG: 4-oxalocrotonate tautomerase family protein [Candidatus Cloacimonetes bacterium]|nr:4-oxalocrotonate tautomerase family protein [Candidatus Cloacimonadota bacterium]MCF7813397.1 4-oxalocrotonate tautomerase family protein [Candidatus Cloacimonadota bacterium]MCF7867478.1 4-oxalocrotonate tautomerase family protein [Candidatus Cloacimonadota bacterium]MCF7883019.1 4-oxalocrotonate tautomerase family protein [Candidatus Cloacimonadota bacterium]